MDMGWMTGVQFPVQPELSLLTAISRPVLGPNHSGLSKGYWQLFAQGQVK